MKIFDKTIIIIIIIMEIICLSVTKTMSSLTSQVFLDVTFIIGFIIVIFYYLLYIFNAKLAKF